MPATTSPNPEHVLRIAEELQIKIHQIAATAQLFAEGATVPFIARYRKEATGELDEVQVMAIRDRLEQMAQIDERRAAILASMKERNLLTPELEKSINAAETLTKLEDIYLPFRPKRRTRATIAKEKGLEPLSELLWAQDPTTDVAAAAAALIGHEYILDDGKDTAGKIEAAEDALAGARDILAERISDDARAREKLRTLYRSQAIISSKVMLGKETEGAKFKDYFDWSESLAKAPSHRILAMRRGEKELCIIMRVTLPDETSGLAEVEPLFVKAGVGGIADPGPASTRPATNPAAEQVRLAVQESCKRLLFPALETEMRLESKKRADTDGIKVFADNLRELLLAAPLGQKAVMAIDPGFRSGCKVVMLDRQGKLLHNDVVYPDRMEADSADKIRGFIQHFNVEAIAIGNGTAGRETEAFIRGLKLPPTILVVMVNESGASIYSASAVAREEFPDHDLTVRGAVSIGRRLMDPLAELVKLDPKSIGVGQYQHDVDQYALKRSLDDTVTSSVNGVGVELNTASKELLSYVSGLSGTTAAAIVAQRNEAGPFKSRSELLEVARLGPKAFEQAAGFLRIRNGAHPLDSSAVHPERYELVEKMATDLGATVEELIGSASIRAKLNLENYVTDEVGLPTLTDIMSELAKPGRDPREQFEAFSFQEGINKPEDLKSGMRLPGIVTNVTAFGAFVDVGVHQDGLVHVSQLADNFVKDPSEIVKPGQKVSVTITEIDLTRNRIALSMRSKPGVGFRASGGPSNPRQTPGHRNESQHSGGVSQAPKTIKPVNNDWFSAALNKKR